MSEINNGTLDLDGAKHSMCNHMTTLGFKGLRLITSSKIYTFLLAPQIRLLLTLCAFIDFVHFTYFLACSRVRAWVNI